MNKKRPEKVNKALKILYASIIVGFLNNIFTLFSSPEYYLQTFSPETKIYTLIMMFILGSGIMALIVYYIGKGKNWLRILFLIMFVFGIPSSLSTLGKLFSFSILSGMLTLVFIALQLTAVVFLFQKPSSKWFKAMKNKK